MTLEGTNTYLYGSDPCAVIDPGPDDAGHLEAVRAAAEERGGIGLVLLTHSHGDHAAGRGAARASRLCPARRRRGARRPARDRHPRPRRRPRLLPDRRRRLLQRRPGARRGLDLRPARRRLARRLHGLAAPAPGRADRADLPRPRPLGRPTRRRSWPSTSSTARCASAACSPPSSAASAPARRCWPRPGTTSPTELRPAAALVMEAHLQKLEAEGRAARRRALVPADKAHRRDWLASQ